MRAASRSATRTGTTVGHWRFGLTASTSSRMLASGSSLGPSGFGAGFSRVSLGGLSFGLGLSGIGFRAFSCFVDFGIGQIPFLHNFGESCGFMPSQ